MYYLGNAVTTIKSNDKVKVFTVRGTSFEPAAADGGDASQENGMSYCPALHRDQGSVVRKLDGAIHRIVIFSTVAKGHKKQ